MNATETAIRNPCYLPEDTMNPLFYREVKDRVRIGMTVNSGFE